MPQGVAIPPMMLSRCSPQNLKLEPCDFLLSDSPAGPRCLLTSAQAAEQDLEHQSLAGPRHGLGCGRCPRVA